MIYHFRSFRWICERSVTRCSLLYAPYNAGRVSMLCLGKSYYDEDSQRLALVFGISTKNTLPEAFPQVEEVYLPASTNNVLCDEEILIA